MKPKSYKIILPIILLIVFLSIIPLAANASYNVTYGLITQYDGTIADGKILDLSHGGHDGTPTNITVTTLSNEANVMWFDGTSRIICADNISTQIPSFSARLILYNNSTYLNGLYSLGHYDQNNAGFKIWSSSPSSDGNVMIGNQTSNYQKLNFVKANNGYSDIWITYDSSTTVLSFYKNGALVSQETTNTVINYYSWNGQCIGKSGPRTYTGGIMLYQLFNRPVTDTEITQAYQNDIWRSEPDKIKVALVGDSITYGGSTSYNGLRGLEGYINEQNASVQTFNTGVPSRKIADIINNYTVEVYPYKPDIVFLLIGTNNMLNKDDEEIFSSNLTQYIAMCEANGSRVVLNNIPPANNYGEVNAYNSEIQELNDTYYIIDLYTAVKDTSNPLVLNPAYKLDNVHLNNSGYAAWNATINYNWLFNGIPVAPIANFSANRFSGTKPLTVQFTDLSNGTIDNYSWDFGNGVTSTEQNPEYTFNDRGNYTVVLTVSNDGGSSTNSMVISVYNVPVVPGDNPFNINTNLILFGLLISVVFVVLLTIIGAYAYIEINNITANSYRRGAHNTASDVGNVIGVVIVSVIMLIVGCGIAGMFYIMFFGG